MSLWSFCFLDDFEILESLGWTAENADARKTPQMARAFLPSPGLPYRLSLSKKLKDSESQTISISKEESFGLGNFPNIAGYG